MNLKRSSASRGELTKAMSATLREVRLHHDQIAALLAGMQQLMDGQAALGEAFEAMKQRICVCERMFKYVPETDTYRLNPEWVENINTPMAGAFIDGKFVQFQDLPLSHLEKNLETFKAALPLRDKRG